MQKFHQAKRYAKNTSSSKDWMSQPFEMELKHHLFAFATNNPRKTNVLHNASETIKLQFLLHAMLWNLSNHLVISIWRLRRLRYITGPISKHLGEMSLWFLGCFENLLLDTFMNNFQLYWERTQLVLLYKNSKKRMRSRSGVVQRQLKATNNSLTHLRTLLVCLQRNWI